MNLKKILLALAVSVVVCIQSFPSSAVIVSGGDSALLGYSESDCSSKNPFELSFAKEFALLGIGIALSGSDLILDNMMHVNRQKYDGEIYDKDDVNAFDRFFMHGYSKSLHAVSNITLASLLVSPALLAPLSDRSLWLTEGIMYAETLLIANGLKELTKLCVTRIRPYMYYGMDSAPEDKIADGDFASSFFSGHSTMAFASASFLSYTFCSLFPDSSMKIPVVAGSFSLAALTAVLRVLGGNHFATDVITGAVVGSSVGFLVPFLHRTHGNGSCVQIAPSAMGVSVRIGL
ncbi:MAG: phosphatase PAP2 family protein [Treponema sp.]|nr:phosphatase PAP2 family protein [Treponema sp.]MBR6914630.1 phosphatase PAP2 family protein [Treponema sp.]